VFSYDFLEPYLTFGYLNTLDMKGGYLYTDHVNDASLYLYPAKIFVHTQIPLTLLFPFLTLVQAHKIALTHGINAGSRCNMKILLAKIENHSCPTCNSSFSIFYISKSANQLASIRKKKDWNINRNEKTQPEKLLNKRITRKIQITIYFLSTFWTRQNIISYLVQSRKWSKKY
jgi:hypothetical protein